MVDGAKNFEIFCLHTALINHCGAKRELTMLPRPFNVTENVHNLPYHIRVRLWVHV